MSESRKKRRRKNEIEDMPLEIIRILDETVESAVEKAVEEMFKDIDNIKRVP